MNELRTQLVRISAQAVGQEAMASYRRHSRANHGSGPVLTAKITMMDERGARVLPVYYSDNYVALLAGEVRHIEVRCPAAGPRCARVALRGWNVDSQEIAIRGR